MKEINIPGRLLRDIVTFAKKNDISKITLFGSRARGTHFEKSDIDIAVEGGDFDAFYFDVQNKAHSLLEFDIVRYDETTSEELREEIEKDGVVIYEEN